MENRFEQAPMQHKWTHPNSLTDLNRQHRLHHSLHQQTLANQPRRRPTTCSRRSMKDVCCGPTAILSRLLIRGRVDVLTHLLPTIRSLLVDATMTLTETKELVIN